MQTGKQRQLKAKFWNRVGNNPLIDPQSMSDADIADLVGSAEVKLWLANQEFRSWWFDDKLLQDLITIGAEEAIVRLIQIVQETEVGPREAISASAQVAAAKILLDFAGIAPAKKTEHTIKAEQLPNDEKALREYIETNARKLKAIE